MKVIKGWVVMVVVVGMALMVWVYGKGQRPVSKAGEAPRAVVSEPQSSAPPGGVTPLPGAGVASPGAGGVATPGGTPKPMSTPGVTGGAKPSKGGISGTSRQPGDGGTARQAEPGYQSQRPLYARLALSADRSRILSVAFDESSGTGTGYDVVYADVNFNGRFEEAERVVARGRKGPGAVFSSFPPINVDAGSGSVIFHYSRNQGKGEFGATGTVNLSEDSTQWRYTLGGGIKPAGRLESAPVWGFSRTPTVQITTKPDLEKKGNLGIGLGVMAGDTMIRCLKGGKGPEAHVVIRDASGEAVHQDTASADKFTFG